MSTPSEENDSREQIYGYHPSLRSLLEDGINPDGLREFLQRETFPLVAPGKVAFVWVGDASEVTLLRWIHGDVDRKSFEQVQGTPLWLLYLDVNDGGRFEYKLGIRQGNDEHWAIDTLNLNKAADPYGENSVCKTYGYVQPEWSMPRGSPAGTIESLSVDTTVFNETRTEQIYLPAGYDTASTERLPLLIIHDGADFVTYADLAHSLDNLIHDKSIPPLIVALVQTNDRMHEYARGRRHARYIISELLPSVEAKYSITGDVRRKVLLGASLGAVAALSTVFRFPGVFGGVVLQSGSFILDDRKLQGRPHPVFRQVARLVKAVKRSPSMPEFRAFVSTGELEGLASENRALAEMLEQNGVSVMFKSAWDGHHWHNWRDQLRDGLMWVLAEPDPNDRDKT